MQRLRMVCLAAAAAALALPLGAEEATMSRVVIWKVKPGTQAKFEEGLKRHNEFHRKQGDPMAHGTFQVQSGSNTGAYVRIAGNRRWSDFDAEAAWQKADDADSGVNTDPYIESAMPLYYRLLTDLSRPKEGPPAAMYAVTFYRVSYAKQDDFRRAVGKFHEGIGKAQWTVNYAWFELVNGGDGPQFVLSLPRDKWTDFNPPEKPLGKVMEEIFGRADSDAIGQMFRGAIEGVSSEIIQYRADLSYVPTKK